MFKPVPMLRLHLVALERDERALLRYLGRAEVIQLTRTPAGPDSAPLPPRNRSDDLARLDRLSSRLENLRRSLELSGTGVPPVPLQVEMSLEQAEKNIHALEEQTGELLKRRQHLQQRLDETAAVGGQISDYRGLEIPLDRPDESSFLHFVTGSLPARNFSKLEIGREHCPAPVGGTGWPAGLDCHDHPSAPPDLGSRVATAGFQPEKLPVIPGETTAAVSEQNQREQEQAAAELKELNAEVANARRKFAPTLDAN